MTFSSFSTWRCKLAFSLGLILIFVSITGAIPNSARAATKMLMMNPVRAIFTDRQRAINAHVINNSKQPITYTISLVTMRKGADGRFYKPKVETEQEQLIKKMIRFSPRRATIAAGQRQIVKLMVRKPKDLPPGEYQTRLCLSPMKPKHQQESASQESRMNNGSMINLDLIVDSTFPIIIQHGGLKSEVTPLSISIKDFPKAPAGIAADVTFARQGDASSFGNVFLTFTPADRATASREIGRALGLAIYIPKTERTMTIPLTGISRRELSGGTIKVAFQPNTGIINKRRQRKSQLRSKDFVLP